MSSEQKITPCLWFDADAERAVAHYLAVFRSGRILATTRYGAHGPGPAGSVMTILFELEGQSFLALNGGPHFKFTPALSLIVNCDDQGEVDALWAKLSDGGAPGRCGWLTDRFGVSWQIVPRAISRLLSSGDAAGVERMMRALMPMTKLDIAALETAFGPQRGGA